MRILILALALLFSIPAEAAPLKVVASFSILGDLVKQVGGDAVEVETLVGPDGDAHVFQPTPMDGKKIASAAIVFINGLGFEGWMERLIKSADYKGTVITVSKGITPINAAEEEDHHDDHADDHSHGHHHADSTDPHAWQDIRNARVYVKNIAAALIAADSVHADDYKKRAAALDNELGELHAAITKSINAIPKAKRNVITSHDAFGYFAAAYGVTFTAPVGLSSEAEPSAQAIKKLITQIRNTGIKTIFVENMMNDKIIKQLASEAGASIGPALYADALSPANGPAPNYQAMFKYNVNTLVSAMGRE